jgi:hypothetical protein
MTSARNTATAVSVLRSLIRFTTTPVFMGDLHVPVRLKEKIAMTRFSKSILLFAGIALAITGLMRLATRVAPDVALTVQAQSLDKDKLTARMIELDSAISDLKQRIASNPKDESLQVELAAASAEYEAISLQMGGDRAAGGAEDKGSVGKSSPAPNVPNGAIGVIPPAVRLCAYNHIL